MAIEHRDDEFPEQRRLRDRVAKDAAGDRAPDFGPARLRFSDLAERIRKGLSLTPHRDSAEPDGDEMDMVDAARQEIVKRAAGHTVFTPSADSAPLPAADADAEPQLLPEPPGPDYFDPDPDPDPERNAEVAKACRDLLDEDEDEEVAKVVRAATSTDGWVTREYDNGLMHGYKVGHPLAGLGPKTLTEARARR